MLPDSQFGFGNTCSCADNLTILNNYIRALNNYIRVSFIRNQYVVCLFLDIAGAFDNVVLNILLQDFRSLSIPAKMY